ncbi:MAG: hypothetical protein ABR921_20365, partial [Candidatus Sulfotelmatobacter sp.]
MFLTEALLRQTGVPPVQAPFTSLGAFMPLHSHRRVTHRAFGPVRDDITSSSHLRLGVGQGDGQGEIRAGAEHTDVGAGV